MDNKILNNYSSKKQFYQNLLTIYGRKPVLECLKDDSIDFFRVHLASSNKPAKVISDIIQRCHQKNIEIIYHDKKALSRISKNGKQDQGVAADLRCNDYEDYQDFIQNLPASFELIALDSITNPQNLGMIIRSVCASGISGILLPRKGCAALDPLVIKASAGTLFKTKILRCDNLEQALQDFSQYQCKIYALSSHAKQTLTSVASQQKNIFVLGNETNGVSQSVQQQCNNTVCIPMSNDVESLNVAITAALIAFRLAL